MGFTDAMSVVLFLYLLFLHSLIISNNSQTQRTIQTLAHTAHEHHKRYNTPYTAFDSVDGCFDTAQHEQQRVGLIYSTHFTVV